MSTPKFKIEAVVLDADSQVIETHELSGSVFSEIGSEADSVPVDFYRQCDALESEQSEIMVKTRHTTGPDHSELQDNQDALDRYRRLLIYQGVTTLPLVMGLARLRTIQHHPALTDAEKISKAAAMIDTVSSSIKASAEAREQHRHLID